MVENFTNNQKEFVSVNGTWSRYFLLATILIFLYNYLLTLTMEVYMSIKTTLLASVITLAVASTSFAKDTLYIVNSGSKGGSYNGQLTALSAGLNSMYDIEYIQAKGCKKSVSVLKKLLDKNVHAISLFSNSSMGPKPECKGLWPTKNNLMFVNAKAGIIFGHKDVTVPYLTDGATVGISGNLDRVVNAIAKANGIEYKLVRYKNSKSVNLGVLNKEVQFGISNNSKRFWKNIKDLKGHYVLFDNSLQGIPSVKALGIEPKPSFDVYIYFGPNRKKLISDIRDVFKDSNSDYAKWYSGQKGMENNILSSDAERIKILDALDLPQ